MKINNCPKCGASIMMVEYTFSSPYHFDGVSEYACVKALTSDGKDCDYKLGRFCGKKLDWNQSEPPYCKGSDHPIHT